MKETFNISQLISKYLKDDLSENDKLELSTWLSLKDTNKELFQKLISEEFYHYSNKKLNYTNKEEVWRKVIHRKNSKKRILLNVLKYASIIIVLISLSVVVFNKKKLKIKEDIYAKSSPFIITEGGDEIALKNNSKIKDQKGNIIASVDAEKLIYNSGKEKKIKYNTLVVPRGMTHSLVLSDGTEVFLNSESKLIFPINFVGTKRNVTLFGEGYFKVAKNKNKPFTVKVQDVKVKVLGTEFNINAYKENTNISTTLVEGSVQLSANNANGIVLKPNFQANYSKGKKTITTQNVNVKQFIAWKNGRLIFENENLEVIMKRISRLYDIQYKFNYNNLKKLKFSGDIEKYQNVEKVFEMIEVTNKVKFNKKDNIFVIYKK